MGPRRLLLIEDEALIALDLEHRLTALGYQVVGVVASGEAALASIRQLRPDLILSDIRLRGSLDGTETARLILDEFSLPVVFLTGHSDPLTVQRAKSAEPFGYVLKPFTDSELVVALEVALTRHELEGRLRRAERFLAATLASIPEAVVTTDRAGRVSYLNGPALRLVGDVSGGAVGRTLGELLPLGDGPSRTPLSWADLTLDHERVQRDPHLLPATGDGRPLEIRTAPLEDAVGREGERVWVIRDITERRQLEEERRKLIDQLQTSLTNIETLRGLLPICAWCKNIRDDRGYWQNLESYFEAHTQAAFTHGICPTCAQRQLDRLITE